MIRMIVVGKLKDPNLRALFEDYRQRMGRFHRLEVQELKDAEKVQDKLLGGTVVVLDEKGMALSSTELAGFIKEKSLLGDITFIIGGPEGIKEEVKGRADLMLSLSKMTFTSQMARVILMEQIYRAMTIIKGVGYHR